MVDYILGYCYIVQLREFIRLNESTYKIGKTTNSVKRMKQYPKGTIIKLIKPVYNHDLCESELICRFNLLFKKMKEYGYEYFNADIDEMLKEFNLITDKYSSIESVKQMMAFKPDKITPINIKHEISQLKITKSVIKQNPELRNIFNTPKLFDRYISSLALYYDNPHEHYHKVNKYWIHGSNMNSKHKIFVKLETIIWLENLFGVKDRFYVEQINMTNDDIYKLKEQLTQKVADIMLFKEGIEDNRRLKKRILKTIDGLAKNDDIQKFMADIYNSYDDIVTYDYKQKKVKGKLIGYYFNWGINNEIVKMHKLSI
jgi:hypothetical protein